MSEADKSRRGSIFLIGPQGTGKSSVAAELSRMFPELRLRRVDELRWRFYEEKTDYSREKEREIASKEGFDGVYKYWKKYEEALVLFLLSHDDNCSIGDFGAGQSVYEDPDMMARIQEGFSSKNNIFLILPCEDREECKKELDERMERKEFEIKRRRNSLMLTPRESEEEKVKLSADRYKINHNFVDSDANYSLATHIVYTNGAFPREVAQTIAEVYLGKEISSKTVNVVINKQRVLGRVGQEYDC